MTDKQNLTFKILPPIEAMKFEAFEIFALYVYYSIGLNIEAI